MRASELHRLARLLREIALVATENVGRDRVTPGQLAIVEDVAEHPGATIGEVAERTHLAQSLVSRIAADLGAAGVLAVAVDPGDRRRTILNVDRAARTGLFRERGRNSIDPAVTALVPGLDAAGRKSLADHLIQALRLIDRGRHA